MDRITILGMDPLGVSIGLALKQVGLRNTEIVGTDRRRSAMNKASKMGAVDKTTGSLGLAMEGAGMVIMDVPLADARELLEAIGPILIDGCVVTDVGGSKLQMTKWANLYLPTTVSYVGGRPLIDQTLEDLDDADADLFQDIRYCVVASPDAQEKSLRTVAGVAEAMGAKPLFMDAHEHDSYAAAMSYLPQLLSSALVTSVSAGESWREMARMTGPEFRDASQLAVNDPEDSALACQANAESLALWLDQIIAELGSYRDLLKDDGDGLLNKFINAWEERTKWEYGAVVEESTGPQLPSAGQYVAGVMLPRRLLERQKQIEDRNKGTPWQYRRRKPA